MKSSSDEINRKLKVAAGKNAVKVCFIDNSDCTKIIKSHSIQENRVLNKISINGEVVTVGLEINQKNVGIAPMKVGKSKASTFPGFCKLHDQNVFAPIENMDYSEGNIQQNFLYTLRALAKEHYLKRLTKSYYENEISDLKSKFFKKYKLQTAMDRLSQSEYYGYLSESLIGMNDALKYLSQFRIEMLKKFEDKEYDSVETVNFTMDSQFPIAVSSLFIPDYNHSGKKIHDFGDLESPLHPLFLTIFPQGSKTYFLISYFRKHRLIYEGLKKWIDEKDLNFIETLFSNLILVFCENFYISPDIWKKLGVSKQEEIVDIFSKNVHSSTTLLYKIPYQFNIFDYMRDFA
ncbi:hypothetical protein [Leptospira wolffii]|uniref:hypothetical protein n=1 Tax=Leptospira wolffii TaxID=409998 RepID=UPI00031CBCA4|nr:hypothetical protein [Leptospira wolffii]EPG66462.1 hypothetical protein LEP1GSC061_1016 [Leptospira wolffii serovar Khorat str. Khorat-H2]